jgi:hypothetical protein
VPDWQARLTWDKVTTDVGRSFIIQCLYDIVIILK